jgi:hypothetical protein
VIKKKEKIVNENLKRKRIFLEKEDFDIRTVLYEQSNHDPKPPLSTVKTSMHDIKEDEHLEDQTFANG